MNKIFAFTLLLSAVAGLSSCNNEEDDLFDSSAATRLQEAKTTYASRLAAATNGWLMEYYPTTGSDALSGRSYDLLTTFNADGSVLVETNLLPTADQKLQKGYQSDTSLWQINADQGAVLSFDSYNKVLHQFSNPGLVEGMSGKGYEGDYEFVIDSLDENADMAMLRGKKRNVVIRLTRIDNGVDHKALLNELDSFQTATFPAEVPNPIRMTLSGDNYIANNAGTTILNIYKEGDDSISTATYHPFSITKRGGNFYLRFKDPLVLTGVEGSFAQEYRYDAAADRFVGTTNEADAITGYPAADFFEQTLADKHLWQYDMNLSDETVKAAYNKLVTNMKKSKYEVYWKGTKKGVYFKNDENGQLTLYLDLRYTAKNRLYTEPFTFAMEKKDDGQCVLTYKGPGDTGANGFLTMFADLEPFIRCFEGTYAFKSTGSAFNLSKIQMATSDGNRNVVLNYNK